MLMSFTFARMPLNQHQKLRALKDLIRLASADGELCAEEYDLLHEVARKLQVEPMELEQLFIHSKEYEAPVDEDQRIDFFYLLLRMIMADKDVLHDEIFVLKELSMRLGLRVQAVDQSVDRARFYSPHTVPMEEIRGIFRIHNN